MIFYRIVGMTTSRATPAAETLFEVRASVRVFFGTRDRGIVLQIGEHITVKAFIDAAYGDLL